MKITLLINEFNVRGGTHKQAHRLVEYLQSKGHDILLLTKFFEPEKCYPGIEKFSIQSFEQYFPTNKKSSKFNKIIEDIVGSYKIAKVAVNHGQCINIHDNGFGLTSFFIRVLNRKIPIIWQINDLPNAFLLGNSKDLNGTITFPLRRWFYRVIAKTITKITVNVTKNAHRVNKALGVSAEVVYCGVDLRNKVLADKSVNPKKIRLLSTGVFFTYRNYETFLQVHKELEVLGYDVESAIIGSTRFDSTYAEKIKNLVHELNIKCDILGDISENELISKYENSDFFFFLNVDQSWGLAVFEAMNLGLPVIVSNSVGATELLTDDVNAVILDPNDASEIANSVVSLINNPIKLARLRDIAFADTLEMTWDKMYSSKIEKIFLDEVYRGKENLEAFQVN